MLNAWEEVHGILTDVESVDGQTVVTIDGDSIVVNDLSESELKPIVGHEISIIKTKSGHQWFSGGDEYER